MNTAYLLLETAKRLKHHLTNALAEHDTTAQQWAILEAMARLGDSDQPITAARLADAIDSDRQTTAAVVLRLAKKGWLARHPLATDKRAIALQLTPAGKAQIKALQPVASATLKAFLAKLSASEQQQLAKILNTLLEVNL